MWRGEGIMAVMEPPADPGGSDSRKQPIAEFGDEIEVEVEAEASGGALMRAQDKLEKDEGSMIGAVDRGYLTTRRIQTRSPRTENRP